MADPVLLDKNVITSIARNNKAVAEALLRYLDSGIPVYISRAAYDELVTRARTPKEGDDYARLLKDRGIRTAPSGASGTITDRGNVYADNIQHEPAPYQPRLKTFSREDDPTKPGDIFVVAEAKAMKAKLWTLDEKVKNAAANVYNVELVRECNLGVGTDEEDVAVARKLLGVDKPPPKGSGGGAAGSYSVVGVADNSLPEIGGPLPKGEAKIAGIQLAFEGVNFVLNLINDYVQKKKVNDALDKIRPAVARDRAENPRMGVLLLFFYTQYQAPEESIIKPGAAFNYVTWGKGATRDEALQDAFHIRTIGPGTGPNQRAFSREVWIPPLQKSTVTTARCPFRPNAVGRFFLGNSNKARFQLVEFSGPSGFDDVREKSIDLPQGTNADFAVLKPPTQVDVFSGDGLYTTDVPLKDAKTANGKSIKVVDLDPWSPFHAKAAMVFPVDDWTEEVFATVPPTDNYHLLKAYVNISMIRWIRPENINLLRVL
jgi:hypothetical protein